MDVETLKVGRYAIVGVLGEGGQGVTLDAIDKRDGQPVAVKRFQVRGRRSWKEVELAEREALVLRGLQHQALPSYVDHFEEDGSLYLVMEKVDGTTIADLRKQRATLTERDALRFMQDMSEVLDYLHGRSPAVIHRDISPRNVIRRPDGSYALVDFGSVRDQLKPEGGSTVVGTYGYMAPEQFQGRALPTSDVYGVAATALHMLTDVEPELLPHRGLEIDVAETLKGRHSEGLVAALTAMLRADPDVRSPRVADQLNPILSSARDRQQASTGYRERVRSDATSDDERSPESRPAPTLLAEAGVVLLSLLRLLVWVITAVVLPPVLWVASVAVGPKARGWPRAVKRFGRQVNRSLKWRSSRLIYRTNAAASYDEPESARPVRVSGQWSTPKRRVRVDDDGDAHVESEIPPPVERRARL